MHPDSYNKDFNLVLCKHFLSFGSKQFIFNNEKEHNH